MSTLARGVAAAVATGAIFAACYKVPYTGRKALNPVPDAVMVTLSKATYVDMLSASKVQKKGADADTLDQIGRRIARVAKKPDYDWEVALIEDESVNAWCLPGGKIGFYTGILPVLENEAGVAFVMGHEVGHAIARHGGERMGQQLGVFGGLIGLNAVLGSQTQMSGEQRAVVLGALGLGVEVGMLLPFSRMHESEADVIGTMYMASAGYPPAEAIAVWDRMGKAGGPSAPAFISTHPSEAKRQDVIREWLPAARKRYARNKLAADTLAPRWGGGSATPRRGGGTDDGVGAKR